MMEALSLSVKTALDAAQTDSDVFDIAEAHGADLMVCFDYVNLRAVSEQCKACRHAGLFPSMFPCNACAGTLGGGIVDYYEEPTGR